MIWLRFRNHSGGAYYGRTSFFGDNLDVLRNNIASESIDTIYLDPPFNSQAKYNILFKTPDSEKETAQAEAFRDSWMWDHSAERYFDNIMRYGGPVAAIISALRLALKDSDMMAYLAMMTVRLIELRRVVKPNGSIFLHCDPTASHYLKIVMDALFGHKVFQNEIIWSYRRWPTVSARFQRMHDVILFYGLGENRTFNTLRQDATASSQKRWKGKRQKALFDISGNRLPTIEESEDSAGVALNDVWDIPIIAPVAKERLGYPTQKPLALLKRVIEASSNAGDIILDPFCGCGTTIHAAHELGRRFIGIDISVFAIRLIQRRLKENLGIEVPASGIPRDFAAACALANADKYQFQWWVNDFLGVDSFRERRRGADSGIDGQIYFMNGPRPVGKLITSVKGGKNIDVTMIRELKAVMTNEGADLGLFVSLAEPKATMYKEAASAGFHTIGSKAYPRIQILSINEMMSGIRPEFPELLRDRDPLAFKPRKSVEPKARNQMSLPFAFDGHQIPATDVIYVNPMHGAKRVSA